MKQILFSFLVFNLLLPSYSQVKLGAVTQSVRSGLLKMQPVSSLSRRTNSDFYRKIIQASKKTSFPKVDFKRGHIFRSTFQLQHTDSPFALTASGFAIDLLNNGKVWGVTAGHVARKIVHRDRKKSRDPHIRVQTGPDSFIIAPIKKFFIGNPESVDIALFEIPSEVLPYVTVLHPAQQPPTTGQEVIVPGFLEEQAQPFTLSGQKVLFSTPLRLVLQKTPLKDMRGFCGSPGFINGRVSMVYMGFDSARTLAWYDWFNKLPAKTQFSMANLHYAIPIEVVKLMAQSIEEKGALNQGGGIMMKVLGHPVALLRPQEAIVFVEQFRNGERIAKLDSNRHFSVNPEKLELFFDLQENDVLRISLNSFSMEHPFPPVSVVYEVNVSTGQVTQIPVEEI